MNCCTQHDSHSHAHTPNTTQIQAISMQEQAVACSDRDGMQAKTAGGSSLVTSLSTLDNTVLACSFMSSLSLFTTRTYQGEAGLEPLSATIGVLDTNGDISHDAPIQVQSAGLVSKGCLWAGAYPDGLLLLMRPQAELEACEARQHERQRRQQEGQACCHPCRLSPSPS